MAQPWKILESISTPDGILELRQRGEKDFLIVIQGRILMNSLANRSETALGEQASRPVAELPAPRVLIGGLGMGLTLRASLDVLPASAEVIVVELNPAVVSWCRGPLAGISRCAVEDRRVEIKIADAASAIAHAARPGSPKFDAIILDLYEGPHAGAVDHADPFYGFQALEKTAMALSRNGIFAVWGEGPEGGFEKRLAAAGFSFDRLRPGKGGLRHVVYIARKR